MDKRYSKRTVTDPFDCTGCSLCAYLCPTNCISMEVGKLGHLFPYVDSKKCINCNICIKSCPSNKTIQLQYPKVAYAAWAKNEKDYISSTSGGAATIFSREIIKQGGTVYGCSMAKNCIVNHIRIDKDEQVAKLKGSKYVQSDIESVFPKLKTDVKLGVPTLFIGTPCQVASVKSLFKEIPSNLFLVDIVCHGVPSLLTLQNYLRKKFGRIDFDSISFRKGNNLLLEIKDHDKIVYNASHKDDLYYKLFMQGFTYRDSCHHCKYAQPNRVSDITIGDFWGLGKYGDCNIPEHKNGISVVLPITLKGMDLIEKVKDKFNVFERPIEEAVNGNSQLKSPSLSGKRTILFQKMVPIFGIEKAYKIAHADIFLKKFMK